MRRVFFAACLIVGGIVFFMYRSESGANPCSYAFGVSYQCGTVIAAPTSTPNSGYGPRAPVGPQASITCAPSSITLSPGQNVAAIVAANAPGPNSYCFTPGEYDAQQIVPNAGDVYVGEDTGYIPNTGSPANIAYLNGQSTVSYAFTSLQNNVTVKNLLIENYGTGTVQARAAVMPGTSAQTVGEGLSWTIVNNEVAYNTIGAGIHENGSTLAQYNYIHHNGREGYTIKGDSNVLDDNIIQFNNYQDLAQNTDESGGGKAFQATNLTIEYNYSTFNHGPGFWDDTNIDGAAIEYNDVENNYSIGIFHEISYAASIEHNYLAHNAVDLGPLGPFSNSYCQGTLWSYNGCGEIYVSTSGAGFPGESGTVIEISNNTIYPTVHNAAVQITQSDRTCAGGSGGTTGCLFNGALTTQCSGGPCFGPTQNVHVEDNTIYASTGNVENTADSTYTPAMSHFTTNGNYFNSDTIYSSGSTAYAWNNTLVNFASWVATYGQETSGTCVAC
jgi:hypothetical protein